MARATLPVALELMFGDEKRRGFCFPKHKRPAIRPRITGQLSARHQEYLGEARRLLRFETSLRPP
ncbi:hypothetical protein CDO31_29410 (plasmid) [Sinorhizobium meliloti]|nr:hypothetical protein CDO31_29410 [Sinorhizobium meliloti]